MNSKTLPATNLLSATDFSSGLLPSREFNIVADNLTLRGEQYSRVNLKAIYNRHGGLGLSFNVPFVDKASRYDGLDVTIDIKESPDLINLFLTAIPWFTDENNPLTMVPKEIPFVLSDTQKRAKRVEAVIINGPNFGLQRTNYKFEFKGLEIQITDFPSLNNHHKNKQDLKNEHIVTQQVVLVSIDNSLISCQHAIEAVAHFSAFLRFVRGGYSAIGNIIGYTKDDSWAFASIGFGRSDNFLVEKGWFEGDFVSYLDKLYKLYTKAFAKKIDAPILERTIDFYRASNIIRSSSLEMGLVASCAGLEHITTHILSDNQRARESKTSLDKRSFKSKLCSSAEFIGLDVDLFEHSIKIKEKAKNLNNISAYELLAAFRNKIVHQKRSFEYEGIELFEIWQLSQWLIEIFIFYFIEYRGDMVDRRKYSGWIGEVVKVPLPKPKV